MYLPIFIFAISLILIIWLISFRMWKMSKNNALQSEADWFRIDLIKAQKELDRGIRAATRPHIRTLLYGTLKHYRLAASKIGSIIRDRVKKMLHHYHEDNDPAPERPRSKFIEDIRNHKEEMKQNGESSKIHQEFPEDEM